MALTEDLMPSSPTTGHSCRSLPSVNARTRWESWAIARALRPSLIGPPAA